MILKLIVLLHYPASTELQLLDSHPTIVCRISWWELICLRWWQAVCSLMHREVSFRSLPTETSLVVGCRNYKLSNCHTHLTPSHLSHFCRWWPTQVEGEQCIHTHARFVSFIQCNPLLNRQCKNGYWVFNSENWYKNSASLQKHERCPSQSSNLYAGLVLSLFAWMHFMCMWVNIRMCVRVHAMGVFTSRDKQHWSGLWK